VVAVEALLDQQETDPPTSQDDPAVSNNIRMQLREILYKQQNTATISQLYMGVTKDVARLLPFLHFPAFPSPTLTPFLSPPLLSLPFTSFPFRSPLLIQVGSVRGRALAANAFWGIF